MDLRGHVVQTPDARMTDAGPYWGNSNLPPPFREPRIVPMDKDQVDAVVRERDALRAENERLKEQHEIDNGVQEKLYVERDDALHQAERLAHENERLRTLPQPTENLSLWQVRYREWREAGMPDESSQS